MSDQTGDDPGPSVSPEVQDDLVEAVEAPPGAEPPGADHLAGAAPSTTGDPHRRAEDPSPLDSSATTRGPAGP
ncbi:MAG: hypothetical protein K0R11_66, partial [Acidimicrobiales bacterium]|nr:hypothetical protein [Acidimicrobiales bacterium]